MEDDQRAEPFRTVPPEYLDAVKGLFANTAIKNTRRAYWSGWQAFEDFCASRCLESLPTDPATVVAFATGLAEEGKLFGTISVYLSGISFVHREVGLPTPSVHPSVREAIGALRRQLGTAPRRRKAPARLDDLRKMLAEMDRRTLWGARDAAVLLVGFGGAFQVEALTSLLAKNVQVTPGGLLILIEAKAGAEQDEGRVISVASNPDDRLLCPRVAFAEWTRAARGAGLVHSHALFGPVRGHKSTMRALGTWQVQGIVKRYAKAAGLDVARFSGQSLRSGFVTEALNNDIAATRIIQTTGHASTLMLKDYVRPQDLLLVGVGGAIWKEKKQS